jgi:hypothetical protein
MTTFRKPASAAERYAQETWREARPAAAMTYLAGVGYDQAARAEFLRNVMRLDHDDVTDFSAGSYVMPADDDYEVGVRKGAAAGARAFREGEDTPVCHDPECTPYNDGWTDGYVSGYHCEAQRAEARSGVIDCPCCGEAVMTADLASGAPCEDCQEAGCEPDSHGAYAECRRPCPSCGDPRTADYYLHVTWARAGGEVTFTGGYACGEHLPAEADLPGAFIPSDGRVLAYEARELYR